MFYEISEVNIIIKTVNINVIYIYIYVCYMHHDIFVSVYFIVHILFVRDVWSNKNSEISFAPWK